MRLSLKKIRNARKKAGLSQGEAAPFLGVDKHGNPRSRQAMTAKELGTNPFTITELESLAVAYRVELTDFFDFDGTENIFKQMGDKQMQWFMDQINYLQDKLKKYES